MYKQLQWIERYLDPPVQYLQTLFVLNTYTEYNRWHWWTSLCDIQENTLFWHILIARPLRLQHFNDRNIYTLFYFAISQTTDLCNSEAEVWLVNPFLQFLFVFCFSEQTFWLRPLIFFDFISCLIIYGKLCGCEHLLWALLCQWFQFGVTAEC